MIAHNPNANPFSACLGATANQARTLRSLLPRAEGGRESNPIKRASLESRVAKSLVKIPKEDRKSNRDLTSPPPSALVRITSNYHQRRAKGRLAIATQLAMRCKPQSRNLTSGRPTRQSNFPLSPTPSHQPDILPFGRTDARSSPRKVTVIALL